MLFNNFNYKVCTLILVLHLNFKIFIEMVIMSLVESSLNDLILDKY